jgi:hypothetical protein
VADLVRTIDLIAPATPVTDREALARALRRLAYGFLFDVNADPLEWRSHARLLIDGCLSRYANEGMNQPGSLTAGQPPVAPMNPPTRAVVQGQDINAGVSTEL